MSLKIAVAGAGVGGLTLAIALRRSKHEVTVFEQAARFARVGADGIVAAPGRKIFSKGWMLGGH